ncbi:organic solute transporter subunit beta [Pleurodeles waltl]|uniref:organic solute transporter subunit beta n=1 Tax=Pleurodeles waltl TaxID=8319 RepID=UPI0037098C22
MESNANPELEEQMKNIRWFFRTEDPSAWNYSILALSIVGLLIGVFILARNMTANRKRKRDGLHSTASMDMNSTGLEAKQATVFLKENDSPLRQDLELDKGHEAGEIVVEWKDGNVTSLYTDVATSEVNRWEQHLVVKRSGDV